MTRSPNPDQQPPSTRFNRRFWLLLLSRTGIALGVILVAAVVGGAWWAWIFVNEQLAPLVERNIQQLLGRPVKIGEVQNFSLNSLRFGPSTVPATPTDPDRLQAEAIQVQFQPLQLIFNRTLKLDVTLVQPNIYIEQDQEGRWITTQISPRAEEEAGFIKTELESIRVENGDVLLLPFSTAKQPKNVVGITQVAGFGRLLAENQQLNFTLNGQPTRGGNLEIAGETVLKTNQTNLKVQASNLLASDVTRLVDLPFDLQAGRVDGNLTLQLQPNQKLPSIFGTATLNQVTAQIANIPTKFNNATGNLQFQGQAIALENINANYGSIPVQAAGTINLETGYNLKANVKAVTFKNLLTTLNINLPVPTAGTVQANLLVQGTLQEPVLTGTVSTIQAAQIDRLNFSNISSRLRLTPDEIVFSNVKVTPTVGGTITGSGRIALGIQNRIVFNLQGQNLPGDAIAKIYDATPQFTIGNISANAQLVGIPNKLETVVQLQAPAATYPGQAEVVIDNTGNTRLRNAAFNVGGGVVAARGQLIDNRWQGVVNARQIQVAKLAEVPPEFQGILNGEFNLSGTTESFQLENIQATGQANLNLAQGRVNLNNIRLAQGRWQAVANANQIPFTQIAANLPPGQITSSNLLLAGTTESFQLPNIQATGQANLTVAGGTVNLNNIRLAQGRWQTLANISRLQLNAVTEQLQGQLAGAVNLAGTTENFQLSAIQARGQVRLSQLAQLEQPLTAQFQWTGEQLQILQASAPGLRAAGTVAIQTEETPQITGLNLDVQLQDYNLQNLPFNFPGNVALAGQIDFAGRVTGTPTNPVAAGDIRLENFRVNDLAFDPVLIGQVNFQAGQGSQLQLTGTQDQIALTLGPDNRPASFNIQRDGTVATGRTQGENLLVNVQNFPVSVLAGFIPPGVNVRPVAGQLSGNFVVNLEQNSLVGDVAIAQPRIGRVTGDVFRGRIGFTDSVASLQHGELRDGESRYLLSGELPTTGDRPLQFQLSFDQARIERVLQAVNIFSFQDLTTGLEPPDLAGAEALDTQAISLPDASLLRQLEFFNAIEAIVAQQRQQEQQNARIPDLAELGGAISGQVAVTGSLQKGLNANFNLLGSDWSWGQYDIQRVVAQGNFANGVLTLQPLRINSDGALLAFSGQLSQDELLGQARVESLPVELVESFLPELPVDITGQINALVTLAGNLENPRAIGEIALVNGTLNDESIDRASLSFGYNDARLNFGSTVSVAGTGQEPVQITGSIPVNLPIVAAQPKSNQISIQANVQNEGLAILNAFTNQISWVNGQGQVNVDIEGTLNQPIINGITTVKNAAFNVQNLAEPLTNVTGTVRFNGDRLTVEQLEGEYSQGQLIATGILPIYANQNAQQQAAANPLTVTTENLRLNLPGFYQGGVTGNAVITGTVFKPQIGGTIELANGEISLGQDIATTSTSSTPTTTTPATSTAIAATPAPASTNETPTPPPPISFSDLQVILADDVSVTREPIFSFVAEGDINLNGTLANPRPQGVISLERGQVNLFVTQFTLARGYEHTATFTPQGGFDPILDVRLATFVPEVTGSRSPTTTVASEIEDVSAINFGTLNSVRVQASVQGPASELSENLELTSEPARSEAEIVALLGGSFLNVLGQPDTGLGIATIAGSAFLPGLQGAISRIGETIGLRELRVFPTIVPDRANTSVLGLAAEAAIGVTDDISLSVSRIFATDEPFRYNVIYRINDQLLVRGSTNLADESRAVVEYEKRF